MKKKRLLRWLLVAVVAIPVVYFLAALAMVLLPEPTFSKPSDYDVDAAIADGLIVDQVYEFEPLRFEMRDGESLACRCFPSESSTAVVFVHGASGFSSQLNKSSGALRDAANAEVYAYDQRGHGDSPGPRGDLAYVGQYQDDLADVISAVRERKGGRIILAGHSMGAGVVQRYAMRSDVPEVDAYLLFAPLMGQGLQQKESSVGEQSAKVHLPRALGLLMLETVGVRQFQHQPVLFLNFPPFEGHISTYSFAALRSAVPADYRKGLLAIDRPLLVVLGGSDTLSRFEHSVIAQAVADYSDGEVFIVAEEGHHVQNNEKAIRKVAAWMEEM